MDKKDIRTRLQGGTPFFPNMLNNYCVEVCLKEDVDKYISEIEHTLKRVENDRAYLEEKYKTDMEHICSELNYYKDLVFKMTSGELSASKNIIEENMELRSNVIVLTAEIEKLNKQFNPLYEELVRIKDENAKLKESRKSVKRSTNGNTADAGDADITQS